jgi:hypothetical protein
MARARNGSIYSVADLTPGPSPEKRGETPEGEEEKHRRISTYDYQVVIV